jgi:hypothetical protein
MSDNPYLMPEQTTWDFPAASCGDYAACHTEPQTCDCAAYEAYLTEMDAMCGRSITIGPRHDPYGLSCEEEKGHSGHHRAPIFEGQWYEWLGGGYAAGDQLPIRDARFAK